MEAFSTEGVFVSFEPMVHQHRDFPKGISQAIWILGVRYDNELDDRDDLISDVHSKLWFSYRKNFSPIGGTGPTSDTGWGCMLRCGQMVLANALVIRHLGKSWRWDPNAIDMTYNRILELFLDRKDSCYSLHQIAQMGVGEGKPVGQWFGPNTVAQVLKKLSLFDKWSNIAVHVAMDNTLIIEDIENMCKSVCDLQCSDTSNLTMDNDWKPLMLFIPLRLGLSKLNNIYIDSLRRCLETKQSLGIIGGKPNHAHYFIGYYGDKLIYLDPHSTLPAAKINANLIQDDSFHCRFPGYMPFCELDPSIALGFYCHTEYDFNELIDRFRRHASIMFEVIQERPSHLPPLEAVHAGLGSSPEIESSYIAVSDSDEGFEIL